MNKYEQACKIWLEGCNTLENPNPEDCPECTTEFRNYLQGLVAAEELTEKEEEHVYEFPNTPVFPMPMSFFDFPEINELIATAFFGDLITPKEEESKMQQFDLGETVEINDNHYPAGTLGTILGRKLNPLRDDVSYYVWVKGPGAGHREEFNDYELLKTSVPDKGCACGGTCGATPADEEPTVTLDIKEELAQRSCIDSSRQGRHFYRNVLDTINALDGSGITGTDPAVYLTARETLEWLAENNPGTAFSSSIHKKILSYVLELEGSRSQAENMADEIAGDCLELLRTVDELKAVVVELEEEIKGLNEELDLADSLDTRYVRTQVAATILGGFVSNSTYSAVDAEEKATTAVSYTDYLLKVLKETK